MGDNSQRIQVSGGSVVTIGDVTQQVGTESSGPKEDLGSQPVSILIVASNPLETSRLQLDREFKAISEALTRPGAQVRFQIDQRWAASYQDLQDGLLQHRPEILHWSGHGRRAGLPVLEDDVETRDLVRAQAVSQGEDRSIASLSRLFAAARGRLRCVVLNTCHSKAVATAIAEHIDCVIGMAAAIQDPTAIRFSWSFYHALALGSSVKIAFELASAQIGLDGLGEDLLPNLVALRARPEDVCFLRDVRPR